MEKKIYKHIFMEYVNGRLVNEKTCNLRYGFLPRKSVELLVDTTNFNEFYDKTLMFTDLTLFRHKPVVVSYYWSDKRRFKAKNFKSYQCIAHYKSYSLSEFDLEYLQKELPADEYFDLWNDMTAKN